MKFRNFLIISILFISIFTLLNKSLSEKKIILGSIEIESPQIYWERSIKPSVSIKSLKLIENSKKSKIQYIDSLKVFGALNKIYIEKLYLNNQVINAVELKMFNNLYSLEADYHGVEFSATSDDLKKYDVHFLNQNYHIEFERNSLKITGIDQTKIFLEKKENNIFIIFDHFNNYLTGDLVCQFDQEISCRGNSLSYQDPYGNFLELSDFFLEKNKSQSFSMDIKSLFFKNEKIKKDITFEVTSEKENFILKEKKEGNIYKFSKSFPEIKYLDDKNNLSGVFKINDKNISFDGDFLINNIFLSHPKHDLINGLIASSILNRFNYDFDKKSIDIELNKANLIIQNQSVNGDFNIQINSDDIIVKSDLIRSEYVDIYDFDLIDTPSVTIAKFDSNLYTQRISYLKEHHIKSELMKFKNKLYIDQDYVNFNSKSILDDDSKKNIISKSSIRITPDLYSLEVSGQIDHSNYYCIFNQNKNEDINIKADCDLNFSQDSYIEEYADFGPLKVESQISNNQITASINLNGYRLKNIPSLEKCSINFLKDQDNIEVKAQGKNNNFFSLNCHEKNCDLDFSADYLDVTKLISDKKSNFSNFFNIKSVKGDIPSVKIGDTVFQTQIYKNDDDTFIDINSEPLKGIMKNSQKEMDLLLDKLDFHWLSKNYKKFKTDEKISNSKLISLECKNAAWKDFNIGQLNITTQSDDYEKRYDLNIKNNHWNLKSMINDSEDFTKANGIVHIDQSDLLINKILNNKYVSDGKLDIVFNDFLHNKNTNDMEGSIDINVEEIFIHHLNVDSLKFLNVLSGFVFSKSQAKSLVHDGLPVDSLKGKLSFHQQKVFFDSVIVKSGATEFDITGYYDFSSKYMDADVIAYPQVTGALPTAALILGGIPASIVMAGVHYLMGDEITKMSKKHLKVSGPIKDLKIERGEAIVESRQ